MSRRRRSSYRGDRWPRYVPVRERRAKAAREIAKLEKGGRVLAPVEIEGRGIAKSFWGKAWCANLEAYSDYASRMPRGRTYVRNGSVIDLKIARGQVQAMVAGTAIYKIEVKVGRLKKKDWTAIKTRCAGEIDSLIELLQGELSDGVMKVVTHPGDGLFPSPAEISLKCSCPDWATMCKHVAATLYGVGTRLDHEPELLFTLRGVDPGEMVSAAVEGAPKRVPSSRARVLDQEALSSVFGFDLEDDVPLPRSPVGGVRTRATSAKATTKKATTKKATTKKATKKATKAGRRTRVASKAR